MEKPSWVCTLLTQAILCFALFLAFDIGRPRRSVYYDTSRMRFDLYFLSVMGGSRSLKQQTHLLKQMDEVAKNYKAEFVVNISEFGDDDLLMHNGTLYFPSLKVPWYTTRSSKQKISGCFHKQIKLPQGQTLDIISVDTSSLEQSGDPRNDQLCWLTEMLEVADGNWCIVVGFSPLAMYEERKEQMDGTQLYKDVHHIFLKFGVNAYLSKRGCTNYYAIDGGISYIGHPGPSDEENPINRGSSLTKEMYDGFLLHRVSPLEIVSYYYNSAGELVYKSALRQRGREVM